MGPDPIFPFPVTVTKTVIRKDAACFAAFFLFFGLTARAGRGIILGDNLESIGYFEIAGPMVSGAGKLRV
jgi:hypothetical protein